MVRTSLTAVPAAVPAAAPAARPVGALTVAVVGDTANWSYRNRLLRDGELVLRHVRSPYEELRDGSCRAVLLRGRDAAQDAAGLLGALGEDMPPVLVLCPTKDPRQIAAVLRLGVTSCLVEGEYDGRTLLSAIRSTAAGHTHLSPSAATALARDLGHATTRADRSPNNAGGAQVRLVLSPRERQVMDLMASGFKAAEIGQRMCLAVKTVRNYLSAIYTKLGVSSRTEAVLLWLDAGPIPNASYGRTDGLRDDSLRDRGADAA